MQEIAINKIQLSGLIRSLSAFGLNRSAIIDKDQASWQAASLPDSKKGCLLLIGASGEMFWKHYKQWCFDQSSGVDEFTRVIIGQIMEEIRPNWDFLVLYPNSDTNSDESSHGFVSLQQLGQKAGWFLGSSPIGIQINPLDGPWRSIRALLWLSLEEGSFDPEPMANKRHALVSHHDSCTPVFDDVSLSAVNPCVACHSPCVNACPAGAVDKQDTFIVRKCLDYRLLQKNLCHKACLARLACPVGVLHRQSLEQIEYHHRLALQGVKAWVEANTLNDAEKAESLDKTKGIDLKNS